LTNRHRYDWLGLKHLLTATQLLLFYFLSLLSCWSVDLCAMLIWKILCYSLCNIAWALRVGWLWLLTLLLFLYKILFSSNKMKLTLTLQHGNLKRKDPTSEESTTVWVVIRRSPAFSTITFVTYYCKVFHHQQKKQVRAYRIK